MTTVTIPRALLEQALEALQHITTDSSNKSGVQMVQDVSAAEAALRAELAKPVDMATEMAAVADRFAHKMALDLECVLAEYSGTWYDTAISTLGAYREAMNAIHERESPTFMGEPVLFDMVAPKELDRLRTESEERLQNCVAMVQENERLRKDAERYRWLRGDSFPDHSVRWTQWEVRCWQSPFWTADLRREELDAAIDAAKGTP